MLENVLNPELYPSPAVLLLLAFPPYSTQDASDLPIHLAIPLAEFVLTFLPTPYSRRVGPLDRDRILLRLMLPNVPDNNYEPTGGPV